MCVLGGKSPADFSRPVRPEEAEWNRCDGSEGWHAPPLRMSWPPEWTRGQTWVGTLPAYPGPATQLVAEPPSQWGLEYVLIFTQRSSGIYCWSTGTAT